MMLLLGLVSLVQFLLLVFVAVMVVLLWRRQSRMLDILDRMPVGDRNGRSPETPPS